MISLLQELGTCLNMYLNMYYFVIIVLLRLVVAAMISFGLSVELLHREHFRTSKLQLSLHPSQFNNHIGMMHEKI